MREFLAEYGLMLVQGAGETLYMTACALLFSYLLGLPLGVLTTLTAQDGLRPNRALNGLLEWLMGLVRSIPFVILMIAVIPLTRLIAGTSIGPTAAIVPLVVGAAPFAGRMVESALKEADPAAVESAQAMGATNWQIIRKVLLPEAAPALLRGCSITAVTLAGYSAMAGIVGGRGLGDIAIRYGYHRYEYGVMLATILLLACLVQGIQALFSLLVRRIDKRPSARTDGHTTRLGGFFHFGRWRPRP